MALSAADLQLRHQLEGTLDPFTSPVDHSPSLNQPRPQHASADVLDTNSRMAFPSLAPATYVSRAAVASAWGVGPRIKASDAKQALFTDSFTLSAVDMSSPGKGGKAASLGEIIKLVMGKYKVKLEASANEKSRQTTFHMKSESEKELNKAKRSILALLSPVITLVIHAPASTIRSIIGPKGATLKQIRDQTSVRVDIPKKDASTACNDNDHANGTPSGAASPCPVDVDEDEESTIPVTLTGPQPLAYEAQAILNQIIASKTSKTIQRVRDIPPHILAFILVQKATLELPAEGGNVSLSHKTDTREITVSGDREAVVLVIDKIKGMVQEFSTSLTHLKLSLPKRQHRLFTGNSVDEFLLENNCAVLVPKHEDPSEEVIIWGRSLDLGSGVSAVMSRATSKYIHEFPLPVKTMKQVLKYMIYIQYDKILSAAFPEVSVFIPSIAYANKAPNINIDLVGEKEHVDGAVRMISELLGKLTGATRDLTIDWLLQRLILVKNAKKLKQFHDVHNIRVFFPRESEESSLVLLVYDPRSTSASLALYDKAKHLDDVERALLNLAKEAAIKTEIINVRKCLHSAVVGHGGTTLNAIIGEDKTLSIKVGSEVGHLPTEDVILVRGISSDVDRAVEEIRRIVKNAENDEIFNSYVTEFDVDKEYVGRIVGSLGAGVNKLREQLGVQVDVSDDTGDLDKKKKISPQKCKIKIIGRKENVEEAKKRILAQIERLADETIEILKIPAQFHPSLIGQSGKYAIRLEDKYSVKITFPRHNFDADERPRELLKPDEVLVKGRRKGVAGAKSELLDAYEFEKESNNCLKFSVPTRAVSRILGKGGVVINEIKDNTQTQIDIDKADASAPQTVVTVRGTKIATAEAKAAILAISDQVSEEVTETFILESKYHRVIIGGGGQGLKDLISRCCGPTDPKLLAGLIRFPRQGEPKNEVKIRGELALVGRIKAELEKIVITLRSRVILGVVIPAEQHRTLIGRGGQHLSDLQAKHNVQVQFPGSRSYSHVGDPENLADLAEVDVADIVKVSGTRAACESAIAQLKAQAKVPAPHAMISEVVIPLKYQNSVSQQGNFFRTLRSFGVQVDQSAQSTSPTLPVRPSETTSPARIDDQVNGSNKEYSWEVVSNYQDSEEGESIWTLKARDQTGIDKAKRLVEEAVEKAKRMSHVGFLTLSDRSCFPRIVGTKGANIARLRSESGVDITVGRENNTIIIIGSDENIHSAKDAILRMTSNPARFRRHQD